MEALLGLSLVLLAAGGCASGQPASSPEGSRASRPQEGRWRDGAADRPPHVVPTTAEPVRPSTGPFVTLVAVGDIRLDGPIGRIVAGNGPRAPIRDVKKWLKGDILAGNLECAVTRRGQEADKKWTFRAPPASLKILKKAGFTVLGLANNHVMDFGVQGLRDTMRALDKRGLLHAGAGMDEAAARRPVFIERNGLRIGFLALTTTLPETNWAGRDSPGVAYADFKRFPGWVSSAKDECDVLVVSFHGGTELEPEPNEVQRDFARLAAGAGADVVVGHHTHVLQPVEFLGDTLVLHGIGNFLFVSPTPGTERTVIARLRLARGDVAAEFVPLNINYGRLKPATPEDLEVIREALDRDGALSKHPDRLRLLPDAN